MHFYAGLLILRHQIQCERKQQQIDCELLLNKYDYNRINPSLNQMLCKNAISRFHQLFYASGLLTRSKEFNMRSLNYSIINGFAFTYKKPEKPPQSPVGSLIEWMDNFKDKGISQIQLKQAYQRINQPNFTQAQKVSMTKYLMSIMYKNNAPIEQLLESPQVKKIQQGQHFVQLETIMYVISRELTSEKPNFILVNNLYLDCFNRLIPEVKDDLERIKCQVLLFKNFGRYMIQSGAKQKGIAALQKSVSAHKELIIEQYKRMQFLINKYSQNTEANKKKSKAEKQREQFQVNALKENIRRLIESMFEALHFYYNVRKDEIKNSTSTQQREQIIVTICAIINQHIRVKKFVQGLQLFSRHYHRLHQIYLQLQYTYALSKKDVGKVKLIRKQIKQFIQSSMKDIEQSRQHLQVQRQIVQTIFSLQLHLSRIQKGNDPEEIKKDLAECGIKIMQKGKMDQNQLTKQVVTKMLSEFIKKNIK